MFRGAVDDDVGVTRDMDEDADPARAGLMCLAVPVPATIVSELGARTRKAGGPDGRGASDGVGGGALVS